MIVLGHSHSKKQVEDTQRKARDVLARMRASSGLANLGTDIEQFVEILNFVVEVQPLTVSKSRAITQHQPVQTVDEITPQQASVILKMSRPSVMRLIKSGKLHTRKVLSRNKLSRAEVDEFARNNMRHQREALENLSALSEELDF